MKKNIALLLCVMLLVAGIFAACSNNTVATEKYMRWKDGETYTFNITLADFSAEGSNTTFKAYEVTVNNGDSQSKINCYKDSVVQTTASIPAAGGTDSESQQLKNSDEIRPLDVQGTYTMNIVKNEDGSYTFTTKQVVFCQYETKTLKDLGCLDAIKDRVAESNKNPVTNNDGRTTLRSETNTEVTFKVIKETQPPVSSYKENKGYYIGKEHQGLSDYKIETKYDFDKRKVSVSVNGGEAKERKLGIAKGGSCIDSNQLLLYLRSLDKSSAAFKDSPSVAIYEPATDTLTTAGFAINRDLKAYLNVNGEYVGASVHSVSVVVANKPFMTQYNLPDLTKAGEGEKGLDFIAGVDAGVRIGKFTTVKFRSGYLSYELSEYDPQWIDAINLNRPAAE